MDTPTARATLETTLERAAEVLGDVTPAVMALFYQRWPDAMATFEALWPGRREVLEGEMVERTLYCLMTWHEYPGEIEIMFAGSVPHHAETLKVPPAWYGGLLTAAMDVIGETIPANEVEERRVWESLRADLLDVIRQSGSWL